MAELTDLTTCVLCGQQFTGPRIAIVGQATARLETYLSGLGAHINDKHPQAAQTMNLLGAQFMGLLFLMNFKTTDAELAEKRDQLRWTIHQQTLKARYSDENLKEQCRDVARRLAMQYSGMEESVPVYEELLIDAFTGIRDALEEPGKYAPTPKLQ